MLENDISEDFVLQLWAIRKNGGITEFILAFIPQGMGRSWWCQPQQILQANTGLLCLCGTCMWRAESVWRHCLKNSNFLHVPWHCEKHTIVKLLPDNIFLG